MCVQHFVGHQTPKWPYYQNEQMEDGSVKETALTARWASKFLFVPHPILFFLSSNSTRRGNSILLFWTGSTLQILVCVCVCVCVFQTILFIHSTMIVVLQFLSFREKETLNSHTHNEERERCTPIKIVYFFNQFITTNKYTTSTWKRQRRHHNKSISNRTREIDAVHVISKEGMDKEVFLLEGCTCIVRVSCCCFNLKHTNNFFLNSFF